MEISQNGIDLICEFEGFEAEPYVDPATGGEPITIGYGTTVYPNGRKVTLADAPVDQIQAKIYLAHHVSIKCYPALKGLQLSQNQFDSLCSFIYNEGAENFRTSSLKKKILINPNDPAIKNEFVKWEFAGDGSHNHIDDDGDGQIDEPGEKKKLKGLVQRRKREAEVYFS